MGNFEWDGWDGCVDVLVCVGVCVDVCVMMRDIVVEIECDGVIGVIGCVCGCGDVLFRVGWGAADATRGIRGWLSLYFMDGDDDVSCWEIFELCVICIGSVWCRIV